MEIRVHHVGRGLDMMTKVGGSMKKQLLKCFFVSMFLCGILFSNSAATDNPLESEVIQIGGTQTAMIEHSFYSDYETMYKLTAARGWNVRILPEQWKEYRVSAVMLSLRPDSNAPPIIRPDREPDRIVRDFDNEFSLWDAPARPYVDAFGSIHVYYSNDKEDLFVVTLTPREWVPNNVEESNGMHLLGLQDFDHYEAVDQKNPIQPGENGRCKYLVYRSLTNDASWSKQNFEEFLLSLP